MPDSLKIDLNVEIPLRDGVKLRADIYRPDDTNKHPVLLARLPYSKDLSPISLSLLSPIRAKVSLTLRVLSINDLKPGSRGAELYLAYQAQKEGLARQFLYGTAQDLGITL